jgi:hypothetical protein
MHQHGLHLICERALFCVSSYITRSSAKTHSQDAELGVSANTMHARSRSPSRDGFAMRAPPRQHPI